MSFPSLFRDLFSSIYFQVLFINRIFTFCFVVKRIYNNMYGGVNPINLASIILHFILALADENNVAILDTAWKALIWTVSPNYCQ